MVLQLIQSTPEPIYCGWSVGDPGRLFRASELADAVGTELATVTWSSLRIETVEAVLGRRATECRHQVPRDECCSTKGGMPV
jgi:hypothetical protein